MIRKPSLVWVALATALLANGCKRSDGDKIASKKTTASNTAETRSAARCSSAAECAVDSPCSKPTCIDGECSAAPASKGKRCDNDTICDGRELCDGLGQCLPGTPLQEDDGNACTTDACDPVHGVRHERTPIDDFDACTDDACDERTGRISHDAARIDDGDDCTADACDPKRGVTHTRAQPYYTCSGCSAGFHAATRTPYLECGSPQALRTFCVPDCGGSFHACAPSCPGGYHSASRTVSTQCGDRTAPQTFCAKNAPPSFYSCDGACPDGFQPRTQTPAPQCGPGGIMTFCVAG